MCKYSIFVPKNRTFIPKTTVSSHFLGLGHAYFPTVRGCTTFAVQTENTDSMLRTISAFGDSIMRGVVLDNSTNPSSPRYTLLDESFSTRCSSSLGLNIQNFGRFGSTIRHGLKELERRRQEVAASQFVALEFGGNDCDHPWSAIAQDPTAEYHPVTPLASFTALYHELIRSIKQCGSTPVILSLPPILSDRYFNRFTEKFTDEGRRNVLQWLDGAVENITRWHEMYNLELFKLAALTSVPIIDITTPFLSVRHCDSLFCDDGIHPNREGHRLIADTICCFAKDWL